MPSDTNTTSKKNKQTDLTTNNFEFTTTHIERFKKLVKAEDDAAKKLNNNKYTGYIT